MAGERIPSFPADMNNAMALVNFVRNIEVHEKWLTKAMGVVERNQKILRTIDKADQIDKLHAEAEELKAKVLVEIARREDGLTAGNEAFRAEMAEGRAKMAEAKSKAEAKVAGTARDIDVLLANTKMDSQAAKDQTLAAQKLETEARRARDAVVELRDQLRAKMKTADQLAATLAG